MKILLLGRSTLFSQPGGDTVQIENTAHYLREKAYTVDIGLKGHRLQLETYDLVHFFNLFRPADLLPYLKSIKRLVVSTIYIDYSEYESEHRGKMWSYAHRWLGNFRVEYLKTCLRWIKGSDRFPGFYFLLRGQKASIHRILKRADYFFTASHFEARSIEKDFEDFKSKKYGKIALGSEHFPGSSVSEEVHRKGVVCAARIEGIKNQLNLIKAMDGVNSELHLYGIPAANQSGYLRKCKNHVSSKIFFEGQKNQKQLSEIFSKTKVHAMPSFYETTGLSSIEALKSGCQIVITRRGGQEEIFGDHAFYCDPNSISSISKALNEALESNEDHSAWARETFSWEKAADEISDIYHSLHTDK